MPISISTSTAALPARLVPIPIIPSGRPASQWTHPERAILVTWGLSAFGLGAAKAIETGYTTVVLWVVLFLLAVLLVGMRWSFGLMAGVVVFAIARCTPRPVQVVAAYAIAWLLLLSGVRRVLDVGVGSDNGVGCGLTGIPQPCGSCSGWPPPWPGLPSASTS